MARLTPVQIARRMKSVPGWARKGLEIRRRFEFEDFLGAMAFVNRVARSAQKSDHHPDIDIRWNKVTLALSTHSEGGLTAKDFSMARECSRIFSGPAGRG
jgi:4a-hydroxytetrahydrobiopterin dehydratase